MFITSLEIVTREATQDDSPSCSTGNEYDGQLGARISSIFVILVGSILGVFLPIYLNTKLSKQSGRPTTRREEMVANGLWQLYFFTRYFGSGVILATAFVHLLAPGSEALTNRCLPGSITDYALAEGLCLIAIFLTLLADLVAECPRLGSTTSMPNRPDQLPLENHTLGGGPAGDTSATRAGDTRVAQAQNMDTRVTGFGQNTHVANAGAPVNLVTSTIILESGIIFHSPIIGLNLAVAGDEFKSLYIVLVFHQTFQGFALGNRLSETFENSKIKYIMAILYILTMPVAIAVGLAVRSLYPPESQTALIISGVFDSVSAGILIYIGMVTLIAHDFMTSTELREARRLYLFGAFVIMAVGAGLMALLGEWA